MHRNKCYNSSVWPTVHGIWIPSRRSPEPACAGAQWIPVDFSARTFRVHQHKDWGVVGYTRHDWHRRLISKYKQKMELVKEFGDNSTHWTTEWKLVPLIVLGPKMESRMLLKWAKFHTLYYRWWSCERKDSCVCCHDDTSFLTNIQQTNNASWKRSQSRKTTAYGIGRHKWNWAWTIRTQISRCYLRWQNCFPNGLQKWSYG